MRFEVPQFIEVEDKIFGPLTWRQFVYIGGGVGIGVVLFFLTPFFMFVLLGMPVAGLSFALAFYPVNNRPFAVFLESVFRYFRGSRLYLWQKKGTGIYSGAYTQQADAPVQLGAYVPPTGNGHLSSLSRKLELEAMQRDEGASDI
ncbi:MAG: PrgI family protein [Candidatus Paceibacterota bacterium]